VTPLPCVIRHVKDGRSTRKLQDLYAVLGRGNLANKTKKLETIIYTSLARDQEQIRYRISDTVVVLAERMRPIKGWSKVKTESVKTTVTVSGRLSVNISTG